MSVSPSSGISCAASASLPTSRTGTRSMKQIGQIPLLVSTTCGCIGHVHFVSAEEALPPVPLSHGRSRRSVVPMAARSITPSETAIHRFRREGREPGVTVCSTEDDPALLSLFGSGWLELFIVYSPTIRRIIDSAIASSICCMAASMRAMTSIIEASTRLPSVALPVL